MDTLMLAAVCLRRWFVVLPVLLLTAVAAVSISRSQVAVYQAGTTVVVLANATQPAPPADGTAARTNPFARVSSGALVLATAVADQLDTAAVRAEVAAKGGASDYTVTANPVTPTFDVTVKNPDRALPPATVQQVVVQAQAISKRLQLSANAPADQLLQTLPLQDGQPQRVSSNTLILVVVVVLVGLLVAISAAVVTEAIALRRNWAGRRDRRREDRAAGSSAEQDGEASTPAAGAVGVPLRLGGEYVPTGRQP